MGNDQNWYRQLLALALLGASKATVEFLTQPGSREDAQKQLQSTFSQIDYEALANALNRTINDTAAAARMAVNDTIDTMQKRSIEAVNDAKSRAEKQLGHKKGGGMMRLIFGILLGALVGYFLLDEQRRNDLLDRLTGASGPIQQATQTFQQQMGNQGPTGEQPGSSS